MKPIAQATFESGTLEAFVDRLTWSQESMPWHEILRASWSSETRLFRIETVTGATLEWELNDSGRLPEAARERITASIVAQEWATLPGVGRTLLIFRNFGDQVVAQALPAVDLTPFAAEVGQVRAELGIG